MTWIESTKYVQLEFLYGQFYTNRREKKIPHKKIYNNTSLGFFFFFLNDKFTLLDMCKIGMI